MSYYVIIRGPLGSGKTTTAKKLSKKIDAHYISIDGLLEAENLDKVEGKSIPLRNFLKVNSAIARNYRKILLGGKNIVIDGNFYFRRQIKDLENKLDHKHHIFALKASLKTCIERDRKRERPYGKDATEAVYYPVSRLDIGVTIDTSDKTENQVVETILSNLEK